MLVLTRKAQEKVRIGDYIVLTVLEIAAGQVRLGIEAPPEVRIYRHELYEKIRSENVKSASLSAADLAKISGEPSLRTVSFPSSRFGPLEVAEDRIITFPSGILGFPGITRYALLEQEDSPICWLQAVDDPDIVFLVIDPAAVSLDSPTAIGSDVVEYLELASADDLALLVILRVESGKVLMNLNGPLAINARTMRGVQVALESA